MCGFAGLIDPTLASVDQDAVLRMTETLRPRGPDALGHHFAPGIGMGHRRLKVIDLSPAAAQPMANETGTVHLVHNGEIYNFGALRAELVGCGHRFTSRSDSEVLLHGYEEWGDEIVTRAEGMFAFVVWDGARRRLLAARDRLGKKPLYFVQIPRPGLPPLFAFASELKALLEAPGFARRLDGQALARFLVHEYVPPPRTPFIGVHKLDAGECLVLDLAAGEASPPVVRRYWELPLPERHPALSATDAATTLFDLLRRAVEKRLVADVPVGIFLSGGIDSAAVAAAAADLVGGGQLATFSIGFSDPSFDESPHARTVARHLGTRHHEERLDPARLLELLPRVSQFLDEPFADASIIPTALLCAFARQHVTVALGGDGGDELFAGYPTFSIDRIAPLLAWPQIAKALGQAADHLPARDGYFSFDFKLHQLLRGGPVGGPLRHQRWLGSFVPEELPRLLSPALADAAAQPLAEVEAFAAAHAGLDARDRLLAFYARHYLANDLNVKVDRAAGAVGLEVRAPLQDTDLVNFACLLPPALRLRGLTSKYVLKRALRGRLPDAIIDRPKQGFAIPVARWLKGELRPLLLDLLSEARLARQGLFRPAAVTALVDDHLRGRRDRRKQLWTLLTFQRWWDAYAAS